MKKIEINKLEEITGGTFFDGMCVGIAAGGLVVGLLATVPVVNVIAGVATGACTAYWFMS
jgi:hypothetical protein